MLLESSRRYLENITSTPQQTRADTFPYIIYRYIPRWHFHLLLLLLIVLFLSFVISRHFCRNCCALLFCTIFLLLLLLLQSGAPGARTIATSFYNNNYKELCAADVNGDVLTAGSLQQVGVSG